MSARPIGEILPGILERCEQMMRFQEMLNDEPDPVERKEMIMAARFGGLLRDEETRLLLQVYELEAV